MTPTDSKNGLLAGIIAVAAVVGIVVLVLALSALSLGFAVYSALRCYEAFGEGDFLWTAIWAAWPLFVGAGLLRRIFGRESG